jgi:hypothetical protein
MNNGSLTRSASGSSPPPISDVSKRLPDPVEVISEIKQIDAPTPVGVVSHEANHVEVVRIDRLIRKGINRRSYGIARLGKLRAVAASGLSMRVDQGWGHLHAAAILRRIGSSPTN